MTAEVATCACGEATEEELLERLDAVIADYRAKPGALIPVLQIAQGMFGYLPEAALKRIARAGQAVQRSGRRGRLLLVLHDRAARQATSSACCLGTACYVRVRASGVLDALKKELEHRRRRHH